MITTTSTTRPWQGYQSTIVGHFEHTIKAVWDGLPTTTTITDNLGSVADILPEFKRQPFGCHDGIINERLDMIVREPIDGDMKHVPVGIASKWYRLLQHHKAVSILEEALDSIGIESNRVTSILTTSRYDARMALQVILPEKFSICPKDGHPLAFQIICFNSVDRSTSFVLHLGWFRLVCSNGLIFGRRRARLQQAHLGSTLSYKKIEEFLRNGLEEAKNDGDDIDSWMKHSVKADRVQEWVDSTVQQRWSVNAAVRTYHIIQTGWDVKQSIRFEEGRPTQKSVYQTQRVPGSLSPANNAYAVSQALSWVASRHPNPVERVRLFSQIPDLIDILIRLN